MTYFSAIIIAAFIIYLSCYIIPCSESSSKLYGKRLNKRVNLISSVNRSEKQPMYFESKGKTFRISVEDMAVAPGLQYETIPAYTCRNIYIDDELVCRLHRLERLFNKTYLAEFSSKRHDYEVIELIEVAYKKAKKLDKEYWEALFAKRREESSFYEKKNN